jgi:hypothetical protein
LNFFALAHILPAIATTDSPPVAATQIPVPFLKSIDREISLATKPRLLHIRTILASAATVLAQVRQLHLR